MMTLKLSFRILLSGLLLAGLYNQGIAQKIKNVQDGAVWASEPVKVDGKITEDVFLASNRSTLLSYTMSNDNKNLYLVIKSADNMNNNKIMMGGITLSINTEGKRREDEGYSITYPVIARPQRGQGGRGQGGFGQRVQGGNADSAALATRKQQLAAVKEIAVVGFKDITDSLISIYNEYEIVAAAKFDDAGVFVYELAIPLKRLALAPGADFAYNIKINGRQFGGGGGGGFRGGGQGGGTIRIMDGGGQGGRGNFDPSMFLPTDFWGKYTLATK